MADLNLFVQRMIYWCRDANLGYSQNRRWDIRNGGDADCSSLVIWCLREAGFDTGGATYTGNMRAELTARGWTALTNNGNPQTGDILLNDADHVAVYIGGGMVAQASQSEYGTADGSPGDQTGGETNLTGYYNFPWDCYLRFNAQSGQNLPDIDFGDEDMPTAQEIADAVWARDLNGVKAIDRLQGIDEHLQRIVGEIWSAMLSGVTAGDRLTGIDGKTGKEAGNVWSASLSGTTAGDRLTGVDSIQLPKLAAEISALSAAVQALAKSQGANPDDIAKTVRDAVQDKLNKLNIQVVAK